MGERWFILADDLTGAADAAIAFARRGVRTEVTWGDSVPGDSDATVLAYDADSRRLSAAEAAAKQRTAALRFLAPRGPYQVLFKKIDSTLRGQPAAEIAALCGILSTPRPALGIFAPANPAMGRTTRNGCVFVDGEPLENSEIWRREHSYPKADLAALLAGSELRAIKLPLADVRADAAALRASLAAAADVAPSHGTATVLVCDAETDADLAQLVTAARALAAPVFFIGTAGLANALAAGVAGSARPRVAPTVPAATRRGALIVAGSLATVSRAAALEVSKLSGVHQVSFSPRQLLGNEAPERMRSALDIRALLEAGTDVLVELSAEEAPDLSIGPELARALALCLTPALRRMSGLIATGGETAAALLRQCYVSGIQLVDEIEAGMSLGITLGEASVPVITKPGGFGDHHSLTLALARLRSIRQTGTIA